MAGLEVETARGRARFPAAKAEVERQAIAAVAGALGVQAAVHIGASYPPRIDIAQALQRVLRSALQGLGMDGPVFRFRLGDHRFVESSG